LKIYGNAYYGKSGFKRPTTVEQKGVNLQFMEEKFDELLAKGILKKEEDAYSIDISSIGADKLLGKGKPTRKYRITAKYASSNAVEKVKAIGGEVILTAEKAA